MDQFNQNFPSEKILQREYRGWPPIERLYLEEKLLPDICKYGPILFIGTSWYTDHYKAIVGNKTTFVTLDVQERKNPDIVGDITDENIIFKVNKLSIHFSTIILNGVIGYGINNGDQLNQAIENMKKIVGKNGRILFGWNLYACPKKKLLTFIKNHNLLIEPIEGKKIYSGNKIWSKIVRLRFMMTIVT